ncbi:MAG: prenyltransferase [Halanaerobium sp.]|nr:prenyltransferase [Halanaerobium sp.]
MKEEKGTFWEGFWQLADPKIWVASTVPMLVAVSLSWKDGYFNLYWFIWSLLGVYCMEIGKNAFNEYVDFKAGIDNSIRPENRTPFSGGKKTIVQGKLELADTMKIGIATTLLGALIGLYIAFFREFSVLWIGLAGFFFATFYSLPPFKFNYQGAGEFLVGFTFGPLIMAGTYLVQTHDVSLELLLASLPLGILIANILWINQYPDYEADARGGKRNWLVRIGKEKGVNVYRWLFYSSYLTIIILAVYTANPFWLLALLTYPLARRAVKVAREHYDNIPEMIEANARTVQIYQLTGLAMIIASILGRLIL